MKWLYRILRTLLVAAIVLIVVVPALLYVGLSLSGVQRKIADVAQTELSKALGARVTIGSLGIVPFNRVVLRDVTVEPSPGDTALRVSRLSAGVNLWTLSDQRITFNYASLEGADIKVWKQAAADTLNIEPILRALRPKDRNKPPTRFDLRVNTVMIRQSGGSFQVLDSMGLAPLPTDKFNPRNIRVSRLRADISAPVVANDNFAVDIKRLGFEEASGFQLENLEAKLRLDSTLLAVKGFRADLPASRLTLKDIALPLDGLKSIAPRLLSEHFSLSTDDDCHLWPPDLRAFLPQLSGLETMVLFSLEAQGTANSFEAQTSVKAPGTFALDLRGQVDHLVDSLPASLNLPDLRLSTSGASAVKIADVFASLPEKAQGIISRLGPTVLKVSGRGTPQEFHAEAEMTVAHGGLTLGLEASRDSRGHLGADVTLHTAGEGFNLGGLLANPNLGLIDARLEVSGEIGPDFRPASSSGTLTADVGRVDFKGVSYSDIQAEGLWQGLGGTLTASINSPFLAAAIDAAANFNNPEKTLDLQADLGRLIPDHLNLGGKYPGAEYSGNLDAQLSGTSLNDIAGYLRLTDLRLLLPDGDDFSLDNLLIDARRLDTSGGNQPEMEINLVSDYLSGRVAGRFDWKNLPAAVTDILAHTFPALAPKGLDAHRRLEASHLGPQNDFAFAFTLKQTEKPAEFFHLPVSAIYPVKISGAVDQPGHSLNLDIDAPYLRQGNKLIEDTRLTTTLDGEAPATFDFTTTAPTKDGGLTLDLNARGDSDLLTTNLNWRIARKKAYNGHISAATRFFREMPSDEAVQILSPSPFPANPPLCATVMLRPGELTFNDSTWTVEPATIDICGREIAVEGVDVHRSGQYVRINGDVSATDPDARLTLDLKNFSLDYLFESLGIDKVMLGGQASGTFYASGLLTGAPSLTTPGLGVTDIAYNHVVLGNALVTSQWEPQKKAITLDAVISQANGLKSYVDGAIFPLNDSLDIRFDANRVKVGFMGPYMEAFASDISGYASGKARLWGNFKYIDLEGDLLADSLRLKVNFTNTYYTCVGDSVHFTPGYIGLDGITIRDSRGQRADLNGWVRHKFFKEPSFQFAVTNAHDFLAYNETAAQNPVWHGTVYGDGSAYVSGKPGRVDIRIDMTTAPRSTFTFVLSDQQVAEAYSWITYRDKNKLQAEFADTIQLERDTSMDLVNEMRERARHHEEDNPSDYNITIQMTATPSAQVVLVMDPVGGDAVKAYGSGKIQLDYGSANNDLRMYGTYTLERGSYNFTLQDVIVREFSIREGSKITFNGDPYAAILDIKAAYALNANLSDLDESFTQDKDLNRTNVPVRAIMAITGDMRSPEIAFDLEFPTLTSDIYRKVRSIISTDDMMNRQMLYLLALNRFYTPDYMNTQNKGNELLSVASSTVSSQLTALLGSIADNWSIAPNIRSERGDFSDVEVDVALSSRLLNNRLLFNGNLGYRDKSLNTNQFIGDFDLEYLLDRKGVWRLKAYNRYNDQNYYLRTAQTTQGVGIVLKKDFDSLTDWLTSIFRRKKKPEKKAVPLPSQTNK